MYIYQLITNFGAGISREGLLNVAAFIIALLTALVLHELAHGLVALWNGDPTAKSMGRLSLNPVKHFDAIGFVAMLLLGVGWAKPVPVNPNNYRNYRKGSITVAIAGVVTNLILAFIAAMAYVLIGNATYDSEGMYYFLYFCLMTAFLTLQLNVSFALFNLLPLFPLDGYRLLASFIGEDRPFMRFVRRYSIYILLGLILLGNVFEFIARLTGLDLLLYISPLDLYIGKLGGLIREGFESFWRLIF